MNKKVFLFAYFKGHGDGLHLAFSDDGLEWKVLHDDGIFLKPSIGAECIMRDPCIVAGHDGIFHMVWTVGWNEKGIGYASSKDLLNWSPQKYLPVMEHEEKARNCWAPEFFYDEENKLYLIYWASTIEGKFPETQPYGDDGYNHRMYYVTTADFKTFSNTKLLYDGGFNVIDATIVKDVDHYLLFMKNETLIPPQKNLRMAYGSTPYSFGTAGEALTPNHYWAEGPTAIKVEDRWIVYFDKYKINSLGAICSNDLIHWEDISSHIKFPLGAQHGYVLETDAKIIEYLTRLKSATIPEQ